MSSRKGGVTKGPPKHQNQTAWKPDRAVKKSAKELGGKLNPFPKIAGVCPRCKDQIEWRRKYGKYKALKEPAKCVRCSKRAVRQAYLTLCPGCAHEANVCSKCCKPAETIVGGDVDKEKEERRQLELALQSLRERERRTLLRAMAKGEDQGGVVAKMEKLLASKDDDTEDDENEDDDSEYYEESDEEDGEDGEDSEEEFEAGESKNKPTLSKSQESHGIESNKSEKHGSTSK